MDFSVAICTWNRVAVLRRTLASVAELRVPDGATWEVVVVDNGSTDDTAAAVDAFAARMPVRRVVEPTAGLSHARNAAVRAARGRWVLWLDDDAFPARDWLGAYAAAIARHPDVALLGGPILPRFDGEPPRWLRDGLPVIANAFSLLDLGAEDRPLGDGVLPFGANYGVRADAQRRHLYSPALGRVRGNAAGGEETAVARAILAEGAAGWYVPAARVDHLIAPERQTVRWLRRYYVGNAASAPPPPGAPTLLGRPRWAWRRAVEHELRYRLARLHAPPARWLFHLRCASEGWGQLHAAAARASSNR